jgi:predicted transposase YdaD
MAVLLESPWYRQILQEGQKIGREEGLVDGIEGMLELKFGAEGLQLMPEIRELNNIDVLRAIVAAIKSVDSIEELRRVYQR